MSGHVFHPGHEALHGITVVLEAAGDRAYIGRYDRRDGRGVHLLQVGVYQSGPGSESLEVYLRRADEYGIRVDQPHLIVPEGEVLRITPLGEFSIRRGNKAVEIIRNRGVSGGSRGRRPETSAIF